MKRRGLVIANYLVFLGLTLFLISIQISLWPQLFGDFPAPQFWITILAYWVMGRHLIEGLAMTYFLSFLIGALTAMPLNLILTINMILFCSGFLLKRRIFWVGPAYLMVLSGLGSLLFPIVHFIISWFFEANPIRFPEIFHWSVVCLFAVFWSPVLLIIFRALDTLTSKELSSEAGAGV